MIRRLGTIRAITTAVATVVVAIALVVGAAGLLASLRRSMVDEEAEAARAQATDLVHQLEAGRPPALEVANEDEQLIQVMTPAGEVVASSPNMAGRLAVARLAPGQSAQVVTPLDDDEFLMVAEGAQTPDTRESSWWAGRWSMSLTPPLSSPGYSSSGYRCWWRSSRSRRGSPSDVR